jgi:hypothetical protein
MRDLQAAVEQAQEALAALQQEAATLPERLREATLQALETGDAAEREMLLSRRQQLPLLIAGAEIAVCKAEKEYYTEVTTVKGAERSKLRRDMNDLRDQSRRQLEEQLKPLEIRYGKLDYQVLDARERQLVAQRRLDQLLAKYTSL